ncbi:recombinase family protein [Magnetofaba australis]|uniref:Putative site-specific recombinase n=1 Tax=Magnetofaba australis IT-1 TaxID=1434232 RepID=A0A1Y2K478_9PROT|nr:recombinase family protein [Magnetofaba australis]OSM04178.1 putative site-specific recombinase [Magnetofaba australis IT-1]
MSRKSLTPKVRCAIYTRKSTDEGLEMEFNSLDAQREACAAYITSQKSNGWHPLPDRYDDGGFSGGNMERPALKRLMADIEAGQVDIVVCYKVDRLSRSLLDFSQLIEVFERHGASFVSITQQFSTTTSMGRLTLNMLLSFAQYEREVIAERIRDKVAASKRKGMWMGGVPPLGYDVVDRKLVINEEEAQLVQHIFKRFTQVGSVTSLVQELNDAGRRTKSWTTQSGRVREGGKFDKNSLYRMLKNRIYLGEIVHKEESFPGEHVAIIQPQQWQRVESILAENAHQRANQSRSQSPAPLKGILRCGHCNRAMKPSHTRKKGKQYRYYTCQQALKRGHDSCPVKTVAAGEVEQLVLDQIQGILASPEMVVNIWKSARQEGGFLTELEATEALRNLEPIWQELFPLEQSRLLNLLLDRVMITTDQMEVHLRREGIDHLAGELAA